MLRLQVWFTVSSYEHCMMYPVLLSLWPGSGRSTAPRHTSPGLWRRLEGLSASDRGRGSAVDREIGPRGLAKQTCEQEAALLCREKMEGRKKGPWM